MDKPTVDDPAARGTPQPRYVVNNVKKTATECCDDGLAFDSGINPSGIAHVDMWFGRAGTKQHYKEEVHGALLRIHLTFGDDFTTQGQICRDDPVIKKKEVSEFAFWSVVATRFAK